jgi:hypothetical protein
MKTLLRGIITVLAILTCRVMAEDEVLIHDGPDVTTPIESLPKAGVIKEVMVFRKQFFLDRVHLSKFMQSGSPYKKHGLSAIKAIEAASATVDLGQRKNFKVVRLELLKSSVPQPVDYYLIEMLVNGSDEHRVVMMDGTVINPRLKRVTK